MCKVDPEQMFFIFLRFVCVYLCILTFSFSSFFFSLFFCQNFCVLLPTKLSFMWVISTCTSSFIYISVWHPFSILLNLFSNCFNAMIMKYVLSGLFTISNHNEIVPDTILYMRMSIISSDVVKSAYVCERLRVHPLNKDSRLLCAGCIYLVICKSDLWLSYTREK